MESFLIWISFFNLILIFFTYQFFLDKKSLEENYKKTINKWLKLIDEKIKYKQAFKRAINLLKK